MRGVAEVDGQEVIVLDEAGQIHPVAPPPRVSPLAFRNAVATVATLFLRRGVLPTVAEAHRAWPSLSEGALSEIVRSPQFAEALRYRGIEWEGSYGLSLEQNAVLTLLSDPTDRRSTGVKLKEMGVPMARFKAWMRTPLFSDTLRQLSENNLKDAVPVMLDRLVGNIESGDLQSIKLGLEMSGRYNPAQQQVQDARIVVMRVVESVIRHVKDPEIRQAILSDVQSESIGFSIANKSIGVGNE